MPSVLCAAGSYKTKAAEISVEVVFKQMTTTLRLLV